MMGWVKHEITELGEISVKDTLYLFRYINDMKEMAIMPSTLRSIFEVFLFIIVLTPDF